MNGALQDIPFLGFQLAKMIAPCAQLAAPTEENRFLTPMGHALVVVPTPDLDLHDANGARWGSQTTRLAAMTVPDSESAAPSSQLRCFRILQMLHNVFVHAQKDIREINAQSAPPVMDHNTHFADPGQLSQYKI